MDITLKKYIAHVRETDKEEQSLKKHLIGVGNSSQLFASKLGLGGYGKLIGLLHDFGKYSKEFQDYLNSAVGKINPDEDDYVDVVGKKGKIDHSTAGAQYIWNILGKKGNAARMVGQILSLCIASHHSGLIDCITPDGKDNFLRRMKKPEEKAHLEEAKSSADTEILSVTNQILRDSDLIEVLIQRIKQISENSKSSKTILYFQLGLLVRYLFSCLIDADRLDTANFESPQNARLRQSGQYIDWEKLIERLDRKLNSFDKKPGIGEIRARISAQCLKKSKEDKGLFTLTVPTGGGKTLSSLRFALHHAQEHRMERIIYVIPYTSIIDQNAEELRKILETGTDDAGSIVLEYHSNIVFEAKKSQWREKLLAENWDAPVIFTTSVQFLECLFGGGTRNTRRMHQLANSVIIFDEIQTLPIRTIHMFNNAISFLTDTCGSSFVLCTATQPLLNQVDLKKGNLSIPAQNELMDDTTPLFAELKRVEIVDKTRPNNRWSDLEIAELALKEINLNGSCLIIVNTKSTAKSIYEQCKSLVEESTKIQNDNFFHLSTNMCAVHRSDRFKNIKANLGKTPVLCVSTQLIEAGVDIDFDCVIRSIAGMDSIAQAAGRCNRNGTQKLGQVYIVNPKSEYIKMLPDIAIGKTISERIFREFNSNPESLGGDLLHPKVMKRYFQYYFFDRKDEMSYSIGDKQGLAEDNLLNMLSENTNGCSEYRRKNGNQFPVSPLRQSFMSANKTFEVIGAGTQGIIVPYGAGGRDIINELCSAFDIQKDYKLLKKAQLYTVNVYPNMIQKLNQADAIVEAQSDSGIYFLREEYYSEEFGISERLIQKMEFLNF